MKKFFVKAIEWLRSRVTAIRSEEGKVKREEVKDTQSVYADDNVDVNDDLFRGTVKGDRLKGRCLHPTNSPSVYRGSTAKPGGSYKRSA